ncbi:MAG: hypothetical protein RLY31_2516 [Bacteroidota bacterium]|jgi:hypothetical protein
MLGGHTHFFGWDGFLGAPISFAMGKEKKTSELQGVISRLTIAANKCIKQKEIPVRPVAEQPVTGKGGVLPSYIPPLAGS